jgi:four helix bundle protein
MGTVEEEADETGYWLELLVESDHVEAVVAGSLLSECEELVAICVSSIKAARGSGRRS